MPTSSSTLHTAPLCAAVTLGDLAVVLHILDVQGPSTHDEIFASYSAIADGDPPLNARCLRFATAHLASCGYIVPDPIAGRSARGRKARRWALTGPPRWRKPWPPKNHDSLHTETPVQPPTVNHREEDIT